VSEFAPYIKQNEALIKRNGDLERVLRALIKALENLESGVPMHPAAPTMRETLSKARELLK